MHLCSSKTLETELYDYVTKSDLKEARKLFGDTKDCHMLWKFRKFLVINYPVNLYWLHYYYVY